MKSPAGELREIHSLGATTREQLVSARQVTAFNSTGILFAGCTEAGPGYRFVRHAPDFGQILACTSGEGRVLVDGKWQRCTAGHAYITAPHTLCAYEIKPNCHWQICWAIYNKNTPLPGLTVGQSPRLLQSDAHGLHHAIEGLCHEANSAADPNTLELWATLVHRQNLRILQPGDTDPRLAHLWQVVRQELGSVWNLQRMSRCAGLSPESLRRLCLAHFGRPPLAQLTHLRMLFAADLLACTKEKISSIAARVGYEDAFAFSNAFKRELGQPPSHHRSGKHRL
jgi:AraC-like DNA-binding protein/quercetin dioxygenase-like cupin family protein